MDESPNCSKWYIHPIAIMRICAHADHRWGYESNSFLAILYYTTSSFSLPMPVQPKHDIFDRLNCTRLTEAPRNLTACLWTDTGLPSWHPYTRYHLFWISRTPRLSTQTLSWWDISEICDTANDTQLRTWWKACNKIELHLSGSLKSEHFGCCSRQAANSINVDARFETGLQSSSNSSNMLWTFRRDGSCQKFYLINQLRKDAVHDTSVSAAKHKSSARSQLYFSGALLTLTNTLSSELSSSSCVKRCCQHK